MTITAGATMTSRCDRLPRRLAAPPSASVGCGTLAPKVGKDTGQPHPAPAFYSTRKDDA